jgi:hypothetical protein
LLRAHRRSWASRCNCKRSNETQREDDENMSRASEVIE